MDKKNTNSQLLDLQWNWGLTGIENQNWGNFSGNESSVLQGSGGFRGAPPACAPYGPLEGRRLLLQGILTPLQGVLSMQYFS